MNAKTNRRRFIQLTTMTGASIAFSNGIGKVMAAGGAIANKAAVGRPVFIPNRAASWWTTLDDILWPEKPVLDRIKRRADGFTRAGIDTAINFGFHNRFDFSNYFGQLHGYYATVCEELHQRGIRFMDHFSCNHVTRPRSEADVRKVHAFERLAVLMYPDPVAARHAQYEGHFYQDLCEVDLRDGSRGYAKQYQYEAFCHNNPGFLDMHRKYLERLVKEVPFDGIEVDDMCSYPGNTTCGCRYCRERFRRDYGHVIPDFSDRAFFGDTTQEDMLEWGNYDNPVYRDWLRMKSDSVRDHVRMIKEMVGERPLMTCCSDTGPVVLNAVALDLEKMAPYLDLFMLENVGTNVRNVDWIPMDAEALNQKDIAAGRGGAPAIALSYALSEKGAYLGWSLARFWGASNWSSTLNGRLPEDPVHALEMEDAISRPNNWEKQYSDLRYWEGHDVVEVRVVNNRLCRYNGWKDASGHEHWHRARAWSMQLVKRNVGYRFVRAEELADASKLLEERTPLVLDGVGCVSDAQFAAIEAFLSRGGRAWMALPFGTHDERGFARKEPLSERLMKRRHRNLVIVDSAIAAEPLEKLITGGMFRPVLKQVKGDGRWAARIRVYDGIGPVIHFMNGGLTALPDEVKDISGIPLMKDIVSLVKDHELVYEVDAGRVKFSSLVLMSPELEGGQRDVSIVRGEGGKDMVRVNMEGIDIYGVGQPRG